ncbi:MAG: hypothetical protein AMXMBFR82_06650 [Candidatus Hydrogenedentota bacterium]
MDTSAGISLGPSATLLCVLNGGDPRVAARVHGYRDLVAAPVRPEPEPARQGGLAGLIGRFAGGKRTPESADTRFPFARAGALLRDLMAATPPGEPRRVCVAVPAWANDVQRQQVATGAREAGWELIALCNEPTAAAMASGLLRDGDGTALVYDLAADHFDVTIVAFRGIDFEVLASDGLLNQDASVPLQQRLADTTAPCKRALAYANLDAAHIDSVVLVGDATRETQTVDFVTTLFGKAPITRFDPEEVTAIGAAVHASLLEMRKASG